MGFEKEKFRLAECTAYQAGLYRETLFIYCRSVCLFVYLCIQSSSEGQVAFWRSSEGVCGQGWQGKQTADPHALPCKVGQDFCPPSVLSLQHTGLSQGCLFYPVRLRAVLSSQGLSAATQWVRARAWGGPGPAGLD